MAMHYSALYLRSEPPSLVYQDLWHRNTQGELLNLRTSHQKLLVLAVSAFSLREVFKFGSRIFLSYMQDLCFKLRGQKIG